MGLTSNLMSMGGKEWFQLGIWGRQSMEDFGVKGISGGGLRWTTLKGGGPIRGSESRVILTSPPQIITGCIDTRRMSRESLLEDRE